MYPRCAVRIICATCTRIRSSTNDNPCPIGCPAASEQIHSRTRFVCGSEPEKHRPPRATVRVEICLRAWPLGVAGGGTCLHVQANQLSQPDLSPDGGESHRHLIRKPAARKEAATSSASSSLRPYASHQHPKRELGCETRQIPAPEAARLGTLDRRDPRWTIWREQKRTIRTPLHRRDGVAPGCVPARGIRTSENGRADAHAHARRDCFVRFVSSSPGLSRRRRIRHCVRPGNACRQ